MESTPGPWYSTMAPVPPFTVRMPATFNMTSLGDVQPERLPVSFTPITWSAIKKDKFGCFFCFWRTAVLLAEGHSFKVIEKLANDETEQKQKFFLKLHQLWDISAPREFPP